MPGLFDEIGGAKGERCGTRLKVDAVPNSKAKILRHAKEPKGLCVNCAVHDWLRNTYPPNMQLAESGPAILLIPHIQTLFAGIMKVGFADANPDEINWQLIVDNWELPFLKKVKPSASNPCSQEELDAIKAGTHPSYGKQRIRSSVGDAFKARKFLDFSFEGLNKLEQGLGDQLRKCLQRGGQLGDAEE